MSVISPINTLGEEATVDVLINRDTTVGCRSPHERCRDNPNYPNQRMTAKGFAKMGRTKRGVFSVHCEECISYASRLLANQFQGQASSSSMMGTKKRFWNSIWSAFVPSKRIRKDCPVGLPVSYSPQMSFKGFLASCFVIDLSSLAMEVAFTKEWAMWKAKNDLMWEEKVSTVSDICQQATSLALDFLETDTMIKEEPSTNDDTEEKNGDH
uniref:Uncharacterized protein n=1 Tax=Fagus sylvatica TaxID=28930 RepID=A0A2N9IMI4_FAGSY